MRFVVRFLRHRGRILSWRDVVNQAPKVGDLRIEERLDGQLHRYLRTARLFDDANILYSNALPELFDVRLMAMSPQAFTLPDSSEPTASNTRSHGLYQTVAI